MLDRYLELIDKNKYDSEEAVSLRTKLDKNFKNNEPALEEATLIIENKEWEKSLYEKVNKSDIPESFRLYTSNSNNASNNWDDLRGEKAIYSDIRTTIF